MQTESSLDEAERPRKPVGISHHLLALFLALKKPIIKRINAA